MLPSREPSVDRGACTIGLERYDQASTIINDSSTATHGANLLQRLGGHNKPKEGLGSDSQNCESVINRVNRTAVMLIDVKTGLGHLVWGQPRAAMHAKLAL